MEVLFFDTYYEFHKSSELKAIVDEIPELYGQEDFYEKLDSLAYDEGICISIEKNGYQAYHSMSFNRGCIIQGSDLYRKDFVESDETIKAYRVENKKYNNEVLIYALKLNSYTQAYFSVSMEPLDSATHLLKKQLSIISVLVMALSVLVSFYLAKNISKPIEKMSSLAISMTKGNYDEHFQSNTDIKEIQNLENSLDQMSQEFLKTEELRRDLMANVSHDLKTPLTMIKAYAEMVRDLTYKDKKKRTENLNVIIEESERLNALVDDILTLSSMQAETIPLENTEFSLNTMILSILEKYQVLLEKEEYQFLYEEKEVSVLADKKRTEQVIYNLLNNAINYTGDDKTVCIRVIEKEDTVRVEIEDSGPGIPDEEIPNIWNKYYHSSKKHKRNRVGTGLGLAIVKKILDGYHLPYGVISATPHGSIFYFELKKSSGQSNK